MTGPTAARRGEARQGTGPFSHRYYEGLGVLLVAGGLLILLSLLSFSSDDARLFSDSPPTPSQTSTTKNLIGTAGATLAYGLFQLLGGAAYALPLLCLWLGVRGFAEGTLALNGRSAIGSACSVVFFSSLLHLELTGVPTISSGLVLRGTAGGAVGEMVAGGLREYFASTGAHIIVLTGLVISVLLATPASLSRLVKQVPGWWSAVVGILSVGADRIAMWLSRVRPAQARRPKGKPVKINRGATSKPQDDAEAVALPSEAAAPDAVPEPLPPTPVEEWVSAEETAAKGYEMVSADYVLPNPQEHLSDPAESEPRVTDEELKAQSEILVRALRSFGIEGRVTEVHPGPVVTMYEFEPGAGVKVARIVNLDNDLALALKAVSIRIVAPIPGKSVVGIEVPNRHRETVLLKEVLTTDSFSRSRSKLTLALGKDIFGRPVTADLKTMPHLLVAGATGAGKSVSLNSMLLSILFSARPDEVKLLLIDPKMLEFQLYDGIPHLLRPVVTDPKSAARGLGWVVQEMERRYKLLAEAGVRNIEAYNRWVAQEQGVGDAARSAEDPEQPEIPLDWLTEEARLAAGESAEADTGDSPMTKPPKTPPTPLPYIVVMIDELADLMMVAPKDVEDKIARLAQMARAAGIHLVLATQRPSVDVLTGLIKANFPARIAFQVSSKTDSRTILDANGAEALLGRGDMLYLASGLGRLVRIHGSYVNDADARRVVDFIKRQTPPGHHEEHRWLQKREEAEEEAERDEVYEQAKDLVLSTGQASASLIQRRLRVGYPRAARMIERMEQEGIVGAPARDGRREVIGRRGAVGAIEE